MSKIGKIFENTVKKIEEKSQSQSVFTINLLSIYQILEKVTNLWKKDKKHDEQIKLQRIFHILRLHPAVRTQEQIQIIQQFFEQTYTYIDKIKDKLNQENYLSLFKELQFEPYQEHQLIFNYGETGRKMYFIIQGEVAILIPTGPPPDPENQKSQKNHLIIKTFEDVVRFAIKKTGEYFGEIALEQRIPRTATVLAKTLCNLAVLTYDSYQKILGQYQEQILRFKFDFLQSIPLFSNWSRQGKLVLLHSCQEQNFSTNSIIYKKKYPADNVYIIVKGEVIVEQPLLGVFGKGQLFGDYELLNYTEPVERKTQATARVDTMVFSISVTQIIDCFKFFSTVDTFNQYIMDKNGFYQKQMKNIEISEQEQEQKIDYQQMGQEFFVSMKRKQEIEKLQQEISKYKKVKMRRELNERLEKLDDPENYIKELFMNKYSHMIGYRNHPLNQEYDFIRSKQQNTCRNKEKKPIQLENEYSDIQRILYPDLWRSRRFQILLKRQQGKHRSQENQEKESCINTQRRKNPLMKKRSEQTFKTDQCQTCRSNSTSRKLMITSYNNSNLQQEYIQSNKSNRLQSAKYKFQVVKDQEEKQRTQRYQNLIIF